MDLPRVWRGARRTQISLLAANGLMQSVCSVSIALLIKSAFDQSMLAGAVSTERALGFCALFLLAVGALALLRVNERVAAERLGQDYVHELRGLLFNYIASIDDRDLRQTRSGAVALRFTGDVSALRIWNSQGLARLAVTGVNFVVTLSALIAIQWQLGLVVSAILTTGLLLSLRVGNRLRDSVAIVRRHRANLAANIHEKISGMASVRTFGRTRRERNRLDKQSANVGNAMVDRARWIGFLRALAEGSSQLAIGAALLTGGVLIASGSVTPGAIVAAVSVVSLLSGPVRSLGRVGEFWHNARVAREKLSTYLSRYPLAPVSGAARKARRGLGRITLRDVRLPFSDAVINEKIQAQSFIGITGENGAGKSTLLALIGRTLTPEQGTILLDGRDIFTIKESAYRRALGMLADNLPLFKGSIERNICYRLPEADSDEVAAVIAATGLDSLLRKLPKGLNTLIREKGSNFSLGERRRIELARALLGSPRVLILDEPDLGLDEDALKNLLAVLGNYPGTVLLATQNRRLLAAADEVWHLDNGGIAFKTDGAPRFQGVKSSIQRLQPRRTGDSHDG